MAVLLPMRIYVGWFWLKLGLDKLNGGWLFSDRTPLVDELNQIHYSNAVSDMFFSAARENVTLSQWLVTGTQLVFGALMVLGGVTRVSGVLIALMAVLWWMFTGYPWAGWPLPMVIMGLTLAVAAAGRYLGLDAILKARMVKVPLF